MTAPPRHVPGISAQDQLARRQVQAAGSSPWNRDELTRPDTSRVVPCPECRARFVGIGDRTAEANLQAHIEYEHDAGRRPPPKTEEGARAVELVRQAITQQLADGTLAPGKAVTQTRLAADLGITPHFVQRAVTQLITEGILERPGTTSAYQRVVVTRAAAE